MEKYSEAAFNIIEAQKMVMGPLAFEVARKVDGLNVVDGTVQINSDPKEVLASLVSQYKRLFGVASVRVSIDAIKDLKGNFSVEELPSELIAR